MRSWLNPLLFLCCALCMTQPHAQTPDTREPLVQPSLSATGHDSIPESLQPWIPWVLKGHEDLACPLLTPGVSGRDAERLCAWPGRLRLSLDQGGASFDQEWEVMAPSWVPLPGEAAHWPLEVLDGDRPQPVLERQGRPMVHLAPGTHRLSGRLPWSRPPESLAIPPEVVLLELSGAPHPHRDPQGRLWFERPEPRTEPRAPSEPERLTLEVMRHIEDSIPLRITTRLVLDVSGAPREVSLGQPMLEHSRPLRLLSPLPTRLDAQGQLRLQVRPGRWELTLESYQPEPVDALALAPRAAPWPAEEVWVVQARPDLRRIQI
ncbi:MAG: hypothetical protein JXM75_07570, partial [Chromatiaceae bacterium]|nr:hypothetical protein [Chromatiaceae bacterium]